MSVPPPPPSSAVSDDEDDSIIDDLSFEYIRDQDGNYIRVSKGGSGGGDPGGGTPGASRYESPTTPVDDDDNERYKPTHVLKLSPPSSLRRASLSRSESNPVVAQPLLPRSFQRVASGPAVSSTSNPSAAAASVVNTNSTRLRRGTIEDTGIGGGRKILADVPVPQRTRITSHVAVKPDVVPIPGGGPRRVLKNTGYGNAASAYRERRSDTPSSDGAGSTDYEQRAHEREHEHDYYAYSGEDTDPGTCWVFRFLSFAYLLTILLAFLAIPFGP